MGEAFSVFFDGFTGRPGLCDGPLPVDADFVALFGEELDAAKLKSELASARVVELGGAGCADLWQADPLQQPDSPALHRHD